MCLQLFQRAKIQDKCKQFTTSAPQMTAAARCFKEQRYKINASNSQQMKAAGINPAGCFKEQRYKINASNSQPMDEYVNNNVSCFKEQRYKINASNSQLRAT